LIIIDGYDEYSKKEDIPGTSGGHQSATEEMPVAALCTKLIEKKLLRDSVVMITTRPEESDLLGGMNFDRYVEIAEFSREQVEEFIKNYFGEDKTMMRLVIDRVMSNENLVTFAHIPMLCYLTCLYMKDAFQTSKNTDDLPVSATDIYTKVVKNFELKHNAKSEYREKAIPVKSKPLPLIEITLDKLSKLAAELLLQDKYFFEETDMVENFDPIFLQRYDKQTGETDPDKLSRITILASKCNA
jgi:hypothetical protein